MISLILVLFIWWYSLKVEEYDLEEGGSRTEQEPSISNTEVEACQLSQNMMESEVPRHNVNEEEHDVQDAMLEMHIRNPSQKKKSTVTAGKGETTHTYHFPTTLPKWKLSNKKFPKRYGLTKITSNLGEEFKRFRAWCTIEVNSMRDGIAMSKTTFQKNYLSNIKLFLGFIERVEGRLCEGLKEYTRLDLYAKFLGFLRAGQRHSQLLGDHTRAARKVLPFLFARSGEQSSHMDMAKIDSWYQKITSQAIAHAKRSRKRAPLSIPGFDNAAQGVVQSFQKLMEHAIHQVEELGWNIESARCVHDACLACMSFGWLPPIRAQCLVTMLHPCCKGPCPYRECRDKKCKGNRISLVNSVRGTSGSREKSKFDLIRIIIMHHKTITKTHQPIMFDIKKDSDLGKILWWHIRYGHELLTLASDDYHLFVGNDGYAIPQFTTYFKNITRRCGIPYFPPSRMRHLFVTDWSNEAQDMGQHTEGAAIVMGNSRKMWDDVYDLGKRPRLVQQAVNAMEQWRKDLLARELQPNSQCLEYEEAIDSGSIDDVDDVMSSSDERTSNTQSK